MLYGSVDQTAHAFLPLPKSACREHCLPLTYPPWCNAAGMFPLVWGMQQEEAIAWCLSQTLLFFLLQRWPISFRKSPTECRQTVRSVVSGLEKGLSLSPTPVSCLVIDICIIGSLIVVQLSSWTGLSCHCWCHSFSLCSEVEFRQRG